ncbi:NUDIX hydrolase [Skermania piniformis]|uniref:NUDIX hydrolase n=1 Tax=Skermania pinensis TaxID=39122 RepID=UPI001FEC8BF7|nr:CoA pyrophosphatase [Skermania piniformis]
MQVHSFPDRARSRLTAITPRRLDRPALTHAAVAIAIVEPAAAGTDLELEYLLTRRSAGLRRHARQWALPGGRLEPGETPVDGALRELAEEVGLMLEPDAVLGTLDDYPTRSGYLITPIVAWAGPVDQLRPDEAEVAELHLLSLAGLDVEPELERIPESDNPVIRLPLFGRYLHAPTAAVLYQFRELVLHGRHTPVAHLEQPVFAWR